MKYTPIPHDLFCTLKKGDKVFCSIFGRIKEETLTQDAFYNSDSDSPEWEIETKNGFFTSDSVYIKADSHQQNKNNPYDLSSYAAIVEAEKQATHRANAEPNQASYNAGWLHGYARALADVRRQLDPTQHYAIIKWSIEDVQAFRPDWDDAACVKWWKEHEKSFRDVLTEHGNEMLSCIL